MLGREREIVGKLVMHFVKCLRQYVNFYRSLGKSCVCVCFWVCFLPLRCNSKIYFSCASLVWYFPMCQSKVEISFLFSSLGHIEHKLEIFLLFFGKIVSNQIWFELRFWVKRFPCMCCCCDVNKEKRGKNCENWELFYRKKSFAIKNEFFAVCKTH